MGVAHLMRRKRRANWRRGGAPPRSLAPCKAFVGRPLSPGFTAYDRLIGRQVDSNRNPVSYLPDDPDDEPARRCACGCDAEVPPGRNFAAGHDRRAVRERIAKRWGSTLAFVRWFDADEDARAA